LGLKNASTFQSPSEAQWEYACRAGTTTPFHFGSQLNGRQANCDGTVPYGTDSEGPFLKKTTPVGKYPANAWGLYDMHGNVNELCADWYGDYPDGPIKDPEGVSDGEYRVLRGGSWSYDAVDCRAATRTLDLPNSRRHCGGRVFLSLDF
jgi:formylglycine-generating enzyme required for sulfatase activity